MPDLELSEWIRGAAVFAIFWFLMSMGHFVILYVKAIYPLRKRLAEGEVVAPPPELTLRYHLDVFLLAAISFLALIYAIAQGFPVNPFTVGTILVWLDLSWTVHKWAPIYQRILQQTADNGVPSDQEQEGRHEATTRSGTFRGRTGRHGKHQRGS